eukprot:scaffold67186_cov18-Tisochrysis_lutea.AAC.1
MCVAYIQFCFLFFREIGRILPDVRGKAVEETYSKPFSGAIITATTGGPTAGCETPISLTAKHRYALQKVFLYTNTQ